MEVKERVEKIKTYFVTLSVTEDAICVITRFPESWWMSDPKPLREQFKCEIAVQNGCTFFMTELENGFDTVFNCIDYIVDTNNAILEKKALLETKAKELTDLFVKESLERLKTLYFAFADPPKGKGGRKNVKKEVVQIPEEVLKTPEPTVEKSVVEEPIEENNEDDEVSSVLAAAMELTK